VVVCRIWCNTHCNQHMACICRQAIKIAV